MTKIFSIKNHKKILLIIGAIDIVLCIIALIMFGGMRASVSNDIHQQAAERWAGSRNDYAQVSIFMTGEEVIGSTDLRGIRSSIYHKLSDDSLLNEEDAERTWIDAYSKLDTDITLRKDNTTLSVNAILYGGEFYKIHPLYMINGSFPDPEIDGDSHKVVLDDYAAWTLFGSNDIVGKEVWIENTIYTVSGVVKTPENRDELQAYGNGYYAYIPIENFKDKYATCYEAVLPNPVENYALTAVSKAFNIDTDSELLDQDNRSVLSYDDIEAVENTNRFDISTLFAKMKKRRYIDMKTTSIVYPYWENYARFEESKQMGGLRMVIMLLILPALTIIYLLIVLFFFVESIPEKFKKKHARGYAVIE